MFKRIVVGVDGSQMSDNAMAIACDLAQKYDSALYLVHTPQPHTVAFAMGAVAGYHAVTTMPDHKEVVEAANKITQHAAAIAAQHGCDVTDIRTDQGEPAAQIIACAEDVGADLIVTGRRGLGSIGALVQGSTSQRVNHLATCATLSVI
ncbi:universal stress protein [uncultured Tateyamaria sp.]|uniref:universal stress protein n=1 Tax=Tateyamaria sp. 1078 TaxID=3417464 RepID=UPI00262DE799|nr:universal stress protein [uncultured Tateyamaria sp.]